MGCFTCKVCGVDHGGFTFHTPNDCKIDLLTREVQQLRAEVERLKASQCPETCYPPTTGGCELVERLEIATAALEEIKALRPEHDRDAFSIARVALAQLDRGEGRDG